MGDLLFSGLTDRYCVILEYAMKKKKLTNSEIAELVFKTVISHEIQSAYISYHDNFVDDISIPKKQIAEEVKLLLLKKTPFEDKKRILFQLAHTPILSAHNAITRYLKDIDDDLLHWVVLAWRESHELILEAGMRKIFGDDSDAEPLVMTGLGGDKERRLRYCFVLSTKFGTEFTSSQISKIKDVLVSIDETYKAVTETVDVHTNYLLITALVSMDVAVGRYIEEIIECANDGGGNSFLRYHYFAVNTHVPTTDEVADYLSELDDESIEDNFLII
jgi:hypothetical protein